MFNAAFLGWTPACTQEVLYLDVSLFFEMKSCNFSILLITHAVTVTAKHTFVKQHYLSGKEAAQLATKHKNASTVIPSS